MSIVSSAIDEMKRAGYADDDIVAMSDVLNRFFAQWDSGGAVWAMAPVLMRLIAGQPLTPLTGQDDEWMDVSDDPVMYQNRRDTSVFKDGTGHCYDIDAPDPRAAITFPYYSDRAVVNSPVIEIEGTPDPT